MEALAPCRCTETVPGSPFALFRNVVAFRAEVIDGGKTRTIRMAGRLGRQEARDLERLCVGPPDVLRLDIRDLLSADDAGLRTLTRLMAGGAELYGASPYLRMKLHSSGPHREQDDDAVHVDADETSDREDR